MKKSRLIALTLVVALMLMGTAYAAWSQTINVSNTISTGKLEVDVTAYSHAEVLGNDNFTGILMPNDIDDADLAKDVSTVEGQNTTNEGNRVDSESSNNVGHTVIEDGNIVFEGQKFFPNTRMDISTIFEGKGDVPAIVSLDLKTGTGNYDMPLLKQQNGKNNGYYTVDILQKLNDGTYVSRASSKRKSTLEAAFNEIPDFVVNEGEVYYLRIFMIFGDDLDEETLIEDKDDYKFSVDIDFKQYND